MQPLLPSPPDFLYCISVIAVRLAKKDEGEGEGEGVKGKLKPSAETPGGFTLLSLLSEKFLKKIAR